MAGTRLGRGYNYTGRQVDNAHPGLAGVAMLPSGAGATKVVYADIFLIPFHFIHTGTRDEERVT